MQTKALSPQPSRATSRPQRAPTSQRAQLAPTGAPEAPTWTSLEQRPFAVLRKRSPKAPNAESGDLAPSDGGAPLPGEVRGQMEASFGQDFSGVRVHEGPEAPAMGAEAFAHGENLHFSPGRFDPGSRRGQSLIGHELAHVVQQREGRVDVPQGKDAPVVEDPGLEHEADVQGEKAAAGEAVSAEVAPAAPIQGRSIQRKETRKGALATIPEEDESEESDQGRDDARGDHDGDDQGKTRADGDETQQDQADQGRDQRAQDGNAQGEQDDQAKAVEVPKVDKEAIAPAPVPDPEPKAAVAATRQNLQALETAKSAAKKSHGAMADAFEKIEDNLLFIAEDTEQLKTKAETTTEEAAKTKAEADYNRSRDRLIEAADWYTQVQNAKTAMNTSYQNLSTKIDALEPKVSKARDLIGDKWFQRSKDANAGAQAEILSTYKETNTEAEAAKAVVTGGEQGVKDAKDGMEATTAKKEEIVGEGRGKSWGQKILGWLKKGVSALVSMLTFGLVKLNVTNAPGEYGNETDWNVKFTRFHEQWATIKGMFGQNLYGSEGMARFAQVMTGASSILQVARDMAGGLSIYLTLFSLIPGAAVVLAPAAAATVTVGIILSLAKASVDLFLAVFNAIAAAGQNDLDKKRDLNKMAKNNATDAAGEVVNAGMGALNQNMFKVAGSDVTTRTVSSVPELGGSLSKDTRTDKQNHNKMTPGEQAATKVKEVQPEGGDAKRGERLDAARTRLTEARAKVEAAGGTFGRILAGIQKVKDFFSSVWAKVKSLFGSKQAKDTEDAQKTPVPNAGEVLVNMSQEMGRGDQALTKEKENNNAA